MLKRNLKPPKIYPTQLALDIIKTIIAKKGPIEGKQLWALSQKVQPTPEEIEQDKLDREHRDSEIERLETPGWVPPAKPPSKEKYPLGIGRAMKKKHRKEQAMFAKMKKMDNGHPVKSISYLKQYILPTLFNLREIEKIHVKRKLNQEEIDSKLRSMTPEARLRKGPDLSTIVVQTWPWRLSSLQHRENQTQSYRKGLDEIIKKM